MSDGTDFGGGLDFGGGSFSGSTFDPGAASDLNFGSSDPGLPTLPGSDTGLGSQGPFIDSTPSSGGFLSTIGDLGSAIGRLGSDILGGIKSAAPTLGPIALVANAYSQMGKPVAEQGRLEQIGGAALTTGIDLLGSAGKGQLTPQETAAVDIFKRNAKEEEAQYLQKAGLSDSSTAVATDRQIEEEATAMSQKFISDSFTQGIQALGLARGAFTDIATAQVQRDKGLQEAIANAMTAFAEMSGRTSGGGGGGSSGGGSGSILSDIAPIAGIASTVMSFL